MGSRGSFPEVKRLAREADHSPPSNSEVKNAGAVPPLPQHVFMEWRLIKQWLRFLGVVLS